MDRNVLSATKVTAGQGSPHSFGDSGYAGVPTVDPIQPTKRAPEPLGRGA